MGTSSIAIARRPISGRAIPAIALGLLGIVLVSRLAGLAEAAAVETFVIIFLAIVVEALPFVLLGAAVSALIEVYVSDATFSRLARLPRPLQIPGAALGGLAFPVCECGSVPVARRLISKGLDPSAGLAFMLAAPIINPIVLFSTVVAYRGQGIATQMVIGRAGLGLLLAIVAGQALGVQGARNPLKPRKEPEGVCDHHEAARNKGRGRAFTEHLASDFLFMGRFIVIGGLLAAALQTMIPQDVISGFAGNPILGGLALMGIAFVMSLCSEADAFVAVSFTQFSPGSQLAFLVFGPVVDAKLSFLYGATFEKRFVRRLVVIAVPVVLAGSLLFQMWVP